MVKRNRLVIVGAATLFLLNSATAENNIRSVELVSAHGVRIKPCMPVFAALQVTMDLKPGQSPIRNAPLALRRQVTINGKPYAMQFNTNPIAMYTLDQSSITHVATDSWSFNVVVIMFWNSEEQDYVFSQPGTFDVELYSDVAIRVIVEQPTQPEEELLEVLDKLGSKFVVRMLNPGDRRSRVFATEVERLLLKYGETDYAEMLSIFLGTVKSDELDLRAATDRAVALHEQVNIARQYFEPYCKGPIDTLFQASAAFRLGVAELRYADSFREKHGVEAEATRRLARESLRLVAGSSFSLDSRERAESLLRENE